MTTLADLQTLLLHFRDERNWKQFHSLKNLIISLNLEAAELLEIVQWKDDEEVRAMAVRPDTRTDLEDECADVLSYLLLICDAAGIDLIAATTSKIEKNRLKYPVESSYGVSTKYNK